MDYFNAMKAFVAVAEAEGFAPAARRIGVSTSAISRHVADLEAHLSAQLLVRTTRRLSLTEAGRRYLPRAASLLEEIAAVEEDIRDVNAKPKGLLRISAAPTFGDYVLAPIATAFLKQHPDISIEIDFTPRMVDIVGDGYDAVLRSGPLADSGLRSRKLADLRFTLCASPEYLADAPPLERPEDLSKHQVIFWSRNTTRPQWRFADGDRWVEVDISGQYVAGSSVAEREAARAGLGVALLAPVLIEEDLANGRLVEVLPDYPAKPIQMSLVWPGTAVTPLKLRVFIDFLVDGLEKMRGATTSPRARFLDAPSK